MKVGEIMNWNKYNLCDSDNNNYFIMDGVGITIRWKNNSSTQ